MNLIQIHGVSGYIDGNGTAQLNLEDVSRGLGFTETKDSKDYVMWRRVDKYLSDFSFGTSAENKFIPENIFYLLSMKASNETAVKFQMKVANEILPSIRKHGAYMTPETIEKTLTDPDFIIRLATELKTERAEKELLAAQAQLNAPKVALYETAMNAGNNFTVMHVAKTLGIGRNKLFDFLRDKKVLMKNNLPYESYVTRGYFEVRQYTITHFTTGLENKTQTLVTPKGMAWIHNLIVGEKEAN